MEQEFLHGQIGVLSRQLQAANARVAELEAEVMRLRALHTETAARRHALNADNASLREQVVALRARLEDCQRERDYYLDALSRIADGQWNADPEWYANSVLEQWTDNVDARVSDLEAVIAKMADALDDSGEDARGG